MKAAKFLETIERQFGIKLEIERSAKNWIYTTITKEDGYKIFPYLAKNSIRYEKHLNNGYYIILK